ncbi:DNA polymerase [Tritonibacter litoralis]|uniref:DNA polymerase n=1 Tax=Tritonibacter litoralis TaxID=2662264 RepID=UPI001FE700FE|nr:DNA polymerase [Tritonibacter litoralis]
MIRLYFDQTGTFKLPVTLTSIGVDLIQNHWKKLGLDPAYVVGKETVEERRWDKKRERYVTETKTVSLSKLHWSEDFFTECYHGGRNEQFWFGPAPEGVWYDYDLSSAYPSAMSLIGEVHWDSIRPITPTKELKKGTFLSGDLAFANVNFEFPDDVRFPVLPVRTETGLLFPRKGNSTTHISEINLALQLGCKIELVEGRYIDSDYVFSRIREHGYPIRPFLDFTKHCIIERQKHPKKNLNNLFWKELVNSTYGKTAQGLRERRVYDLRSAQTQRLEPSKITNPVYAAYITALCRATLGEIMNALPRSVEIFSVTTDGFLTTATDAQMRKTTIINLGWDYRSARGILVGDTQIYETKHVIRQPIGWRTRGQATLKPSQVSDFEGVNLEPREDERVVLAKGGIKLDRTWSKSQQNDEIVELLLNRKPTDTMAVVLGAGIREMHEKGMDFVDKTMTKRLSMEFDWKRRPHAAGDVPVQFGTQSEVSHLAFSTIPWDSVEQYNTVRELWRSYTKDAPRCLKSFEDYQKWATYFESKLAAQGPAEAYLAKEDGILKRIRRDLVIAQRLRKAGTHELKPSAVDQDVLPDGFKLKAETFANILNDRFGIPCAKTDVDNARKKKAFVTKQVPNCDQSVKILEAIKRDLFPKLDIEQFLTPKATFDLKIVERDMAKPLQEDL